jgi:protein-S-isoprenylcysteine O-methyltransferase Ste14
MLVSLLVTLLPVLFLAGLIQKALAMRRRNVDMDGTPPIPKPLFVSSKWAIVVAWGAMVIQSWGVNLSFIDAPDLVTGMAIGLWVLAFALLFVGRAGLGDSFRIGSPRESTGLKQAGLYGFSRNPMYVGVYTTLCAAVLRTLNPVLLLVVVYVIGLDPVS